MLLFMVNLTHNRFQKPKLVYTKSFDMNQQQTFTGSSFMLDGWEVPLYTMIPSLHRERRWKQNEMFYSWRVFIGGHIGAMPLACPFGQGLDG